MALVRGSVSIAGDESVSGSGYALALYTEIATREQDPAQGGRPLPSLTKPPTFTQTQKAWEAAIKPVRLRTLQAWARRANADSLIVDHLLANAQLQVTASDAGLQRDNTGGNPATLAPAGTVTFGNLL